KTQSGGHGCCTSEKSDSTRSSFHRWPVQASLDLQRALAVDPAQRPEAAVKGLRIDRLRNPYVELRPGFGGHHVRPRAATNHSRVYGDATGLVGEGAGALDLPPKLEHGAVPVAEVD